MPTVEIAGQPIANWTIEVIRGGVFQVPVNFLDSNGVVVPILSASIIITPEGASEVQWTQANGLFQNLAPGEYVTALDEAYTTALTWSFGRYRIEIVNGSGFTVPCITEGFAFVKDC